MPPSDMFSERDALAKRLASLEDTFNKSLHLLTKANKQETVGDHNQVLASENISLKEQIKNTSGIHNDSDVHRREESYTPPRLKNRTDWKN